MGEKGAKRGGLIDVVVQLGEQYVEVDLVDRGAVLQLLEIGYLAVVAVQAVALEHGECLGVAPEDIHYGHLFADHVTSGRVHGV